jgi:hypothetical protein
LNSIWVHLDLKVLIGVPWGAHVGWCDVHAEAAFGESRSIELTATDNSYRDMGHAITPVQQDC